jgi:two-component system, NarL family, response regulator LiaR
MCRLVEAAPGMVLQGAADSGESAVALATELEPDMVIMDIVMPGLGGVAASRWIKTSRPETVVVLVSSTHPDDLPEAVHDSLADAIVWKPNLRPALLEELWLTHCGSLRGDSSPS